MIYKRKKIYSKPKLKDDSKLFYKYQNGKTFEEKYEINEKNDLSSENNSIILKQPLIKTYLIKLKRGLSGKKIPNNIFYNELSRNNSIINEININIPSNEKQHLNNEINGNTFFFGNKNNLSFNQSIQLKKETLINNNKNKNFSLESEKNDNFVKNNFFFSQDISLNNYNKREKGKSKTKIKFSLRKKLLEDKKKKKRTLSTISIPKRKNLKNNSFNFSSKNNLIKNKHNKSKEYLDINISKYDIDSNNFSKKIKILLNKK